MQTLPFHLVDVFTNQAFGGNQLAVFTDGRGISGETMQQLAREFNFSEITFVLPPDKPDNDFRVRIFTPATEMPTAGHPTVGTAYILAHQERIDTSEDNLTITFEQIVGDIPVEIQLQDGTPGIVTMTQPLPQFGPVFSDRQAIAQTLSINESDIVADLPLETVSCGVPFLFVPLHSMQAVKRIKFQNDVWERNLKDFAAAQVFVFARETAHDTSTIHSRMFAPGLGVAEDPATGSAGGPLGSYLVRHGLLTPAEARSFVSEQGFEIGRPSLIHISIDVEGGEITGARVGGECVYMGQGAIHLP